MLEYNKSKTAVYLTSARLCRLQSVAVSEDMKPQLKALLEAEFARVGYDPSKTIKPLRGIKGEEVSGPS